MPPLTESLASRGFGLLSTVAWWTCSKFASPFGVLSIEVVLERDLSVSVQPVIPKQEVTLRDAVEDDLPAITRLYAAEPYLYLGDSSVNNDVEADSAGMELYRARMRRGEKCFIAFSGSEIAHVNWICFHWGEEAIDGHLFIPSPRAVYTTDGLTTDRFRGCNIHA